MPDKFHRKTPAQPEKRRQKKTRQTLSMAAHRCAFPLRIGCLKTVADFIAWGQAAVRADTERRIAWESFHQKERDTKLHRQWQDACALFQYTLDHAYPADFWEGFATLLAGTSDNLEPYLAFLEADLYFFRSGYAKTKIIRGLKRLPLTSAQKSCLQNVVLRVVDKGFRREFRDYCRLARYIQSPDWLKEVETRLASDDPDIAVRAKWVLEACRKK